MNDSPAPTPRGAAADVTIRELRADDVPFAMAMKRLAGWNQTERDWLGYIGYEPAGCFLAETGGRPAGTATSIAYGNRFGWVGMVLVQPELRRFGIGTKLLRRTIDYLQQQRGVSCVKLDATAMGRKVYTPMGFRDEYEVSRYEGIAPRDVPGTSARVQFMTERDLPELAAFDAPIFGAERTAVLRSMRARNPEFCYVRRDRADGDRTQGAAYAVSGYIIARHGEHAVQVGPWLARDAEGADELWRGFLRRVAGKRVFVDVPHPNAAGLALVERYGFTVQRGFTRMFLGENVHPGDPSRVFGTSSAEKG